jgi:tetratricopeptide (TPR) repeat protein
MVAVVCAFGVSIGIACADETKTTAATAAGSAAPTRWEVVMSKAIHSEREGKFLEAEPLYREAVSISEKMGLGDPHHAASLSALAANYDNLGRYADAERVYRRAMRMVADTQGRRSADYATLETNLAATYTHRGESLKGEPLLVEAIATLESLEQLDEERLALARDGYGAVLLARHKYDEAAEMFEQVLTVFRKTPHSWQCRSAIALNNLAVVRGYQGRQEEGVRLLQQAVAETEASLGSEHPIMLRTLNNLAVGLASLGRFDEAFATSTRAVALAEKTLGRHHPVYGEVLANYAAVMRKAGRKSEAKTLENEAKGIIRESTRTNGMTIDVTSFR